MRIEQLRVGVGVDARATFAGMERYTTALAAFLRRAVAPGATTPGGGG